MMVDLNIQIRRVSSKYKEIKVQVGNTIVDLGLFDENELITLAQHLQDIVDELGGN